MQLMDDMVKGLSFDPYAPINMGPSSKYHSPYRYVDGVNGGFMPQDSKYWAEQGKIVETEQGHNSYYENDRYIKMHKSEGLQEALDQLIKGGPGSGRHKGPEHEPLGAGGTTIEGKESAFYMNPLKKIAEKMRMKDIVAKKDKEAEEKKKKEKEERVKPAAEKHKEDIRRLASYMKSEDEMDDNEKQLMKSQGFTSAPISLIDMKEDNTELAKSIEAGGIQPQGRYSTDAEQRPHQNMMKAYGSENLKNNHGEKFHKDNDKEVEKKVTKIDEVENKDDTPKSRKLPDTALGKSEETEKALDHLMKSGDMAAAKMEAKEKKGKKKITEGVDDMIDSEMDEHEDDMHKKSTADLLNDLTKGATSDGSLRDRYDDQGKGGDGGMAEGDADNDGGAVDTEDDEVDEAQQEAVKELKEGQTKGEDRGAAEEAFKSDGGLAGLAKACGPKDFKNLDELSEEGHDKAKKLGKKVKDMHENSKGK